MMNALVSPETGLATMSANVAVGDWYVAAGIRRCVEALVPPRPSAPIGDFPFEPPRCLRMGFIGVSAAGETQEVSVA
jgi:hypothetical protein